MSILVCLVCKREDKERLFRAPNDEAGLALMREHLRSDHNVTST